MKPDSNLPNDPELPGLVAIRAGGLASALRGLSLNDRLVVGADDDFVALSLLGAAELERESDSGWRELNCVLHGYTPGSRATFEVRVGPRRFALKAYAKDAGPEAELYEALAAAGLAGDSGARVPRLLAWNRDLKLLALGWLEGRPANELLTEGQGVRAGELAARWLQRAGSLFVTLGPEVGVARVLKKSNKGVGLLSAADPALGRAATALLAALERTQPDHQHHHLVHGSFYARHVLDLGDGPGVIDWDAFGHGSIEFDAGMFLATLSRHRLRNEPSAGAAAQAEEAFLAATSGLLDSRALAWYWAAALLHLAWRLLKRQAPAESHPLLRGAARLAEIAEATSRRYPLEEMMHVVRG